MPSPRFLKERGIATGIHYPVPSHRQPAVEHLAPPPLERTERLVQEILTLPISAGHTDAEIDEVIAAVRAFSRGVSESLRILQLYPKADYFTGAAIQLRDLAWGLHARGHEVVVGTRPSAVWAEQCAAAGIPHAAIPMRSEVDLASAVALARLIRARRFDIVHCQKGKARTLALLAGLLVKIPVLILNRGVSFPLDRWNRLGYTNRRVTAIVAVCESIKRGLVAAHVSADKIEVIYSGTDLDRFHPGVDGGGIRAELGLEPGHQLITQIGMRSWRGNDDVLDAMVRVHRAAPQCRLLFVGAPPPRITSTLDKARARGLDGMRLRPRPPRATFRRFSRAATSSWTRRTPGSASPARCAKRSPWRPR